MLLAVARQQAQQADLQRQQVDLLRRQQGLPPLPAPMVYRRRHNPVVTALLCWLVIVASTALMTLLAVTDANDQASPATAAFPATAGGGIAWPITIGSIVILTSTVLLLAFVSWWLKSTSDAPVQQGR